LVSIENFREDLPFYQERLLVVSDNLLAKLSTLGFEVESTQFREIFNPSAALTMAGNTLTGFGNVMADGFLILLTVIFILAEEVNFTEKFRYATGRQSNAMNALHSLFMADRRRLFCALGFAGVFVKFYSDFRFYISGSATGFIGLGTAWRWRGHHYGDCIFSGKYCCGLGARATFYG